MASGESGASPAGFVLRDYRSDDLAALEEYWTPAVRRYLSGGPGPEGHQDLVPVLERILAAARDEDRLRLDLVAEVDGHFVGTGRVQVRDERNATGDIGYALAERAWGRGYGTQLARALIELGFGRLGLHRIWATVHPENSASVRVLEKSGMVYEGRLRDDRRTSEGWCDSLLYAVTRCSFNDGGRGSTHALLHPPVALVTSSPQWARDFDALADVLRRALRAIALHIDHIGSTSVPGLPAKDVIDVQVVVERLDGHLIGNALEPLGFTLAPEAWNGRDHVPADWTGDPSQWDKLVFRPPAEARASNVHVRRTDSPNERYALLFRDFLRSNEAARRTWGQIKQRLVDSGATLSQYGAVKDPATDILIASAEAWVAANRWSPRSRQERS